MGTGHLQARLLNLLSCLETESRAAFQESLPGSIGGWTGGDSLARITKRYPVIAFDGCDLTFNHDGSSLIEADAKQTRAKHDQIPEPVFPMALGEMSIENHPRQQTEPATERRILQ